MRPFHQLYGVAALVLVAVSSLTAACDRGGTAPGGSTRWDRPNDQAKYVEKAGLSLMPEEGRTVHYHAHLDIIVAGRRVRVPAGLGINAGPDGELPDHGSPGIAALHTHDTSGVLHVESPKKATYKLGQIFILWNVSLGRDRVGPYTTDRKRHREVAVYVNGSRWAGDPRLIKLTPHEEIAVVVRTLEEKLRVPGSYHFAPGQ